MRFSPAVYDQYSAVFYGKIPSAQTVLLQGYFEIAEGLGLVRTIDLREGLVCVISTPDLAEAVSGFLVSLTELPQRARVEWSSVPEPEDRERYLGHGRQNTGRQNTGRQNGNLKRSSPI